MSDASQPRPAGGPHQRSWKNYLLVRNFQLKYTAYIVVISSILCAVLGLVIYSRTQEAYRNAQDALTSAQQANEEARAASKMLALDSLADPEAGKAVVDQEDLKFAKRADDLKIRLDKQASESAWTPIFLGGLLGVLVLLLTVFGIVITHRVAGPLFVLGKTFSNIAGADYRIQKRALRKGDELADFFQKSIDALQALNDRSTQEIAALQEQLAVVKQLKERGGDPQLIARLEAGLNDILAKHAAAIGQKA